MIARLDGSTVASIGAGKAGRTDGDYATAEFNAPQGMALEGGNALRGRYRENHLIRKVDLAARRVTTIAGIGRQGRGTPPFGHVEKPLQTALSSPWDLWIHGGQIYIAMAGWHQIWRMKLDASAIGVYAGNGQEDIVDGPVAPQRPAQAGFAAFAQPSGLTSDGQSLYVADSEGSSIRAVPFSMESETCGPSWGQRTCLPPVLFTFGDVDGRGERVRLQHPLGITYYEGKTLRGGHLQQQDQG